MKAFNLPFCSILLLCFLIILSGEVAAQQNAIYSNFMFNRLAINPAYAGSQDQLNVTAIHRRQWENFEGAPSTSAFSAHKYIKDKNIGLGMMASSDQIGIHRDNRLYLVYAYKIKMKAGTLSMGLQGGFSRLSSDFSQLNLRSDRDAMMSGMRSDFNPNFGTGVYFSNANVFAGVSVPYLINNRLEGATETLAEAREARYYLLTAGTVLTLNQDLKLVPSALFRVQEGNAVGMDINTNLVISEILTVGLSYRTEQALTALMGLNLSENLSMGYAYDLTTTDIGQYSNGSHEFMLNFRIPYSKLCHTYF
ncbi:MAG: type IX secretion system membrane protein PorP/SprF [Cyclobacteriaceae bacterium]